MIEESKNYKYDAFISHRHRPFDKLVAEKLQVLLETYKPPKGIDASPMKGRVFLDVFELAASENLNTVITEALQQSRYLVVICSEETKESEWCMKEIEYFKEIHGGKCENILTVLISGKPEHVLHELLYRVSQENILSTLETVAVETKIVPLAANLTAGTRHKSLKLLKTEFLRIAAPLLGCDYRDLYNRHQRRFRRRVIGAATTIVIIMSVVALTVGVFENRSRNATALLYYRQGVESMERDNNYALAMMYFADSLSLRPNSIAAQTTGLSLLLQEKTWPYIAASGKGRIIGDTLVLHESERSNINESGAIYIDDSIFLEDIQAYDKLSGALLVWKSGIYEVTDVYGNILDTLNSGITFRSNTSGYVNMSATSGCWVFEKRYSNSRNVYIYQIDSGNVTVLEPPVNINPKCDLNSIFMEAEHLPLSIAAYNKGTRVAISFAGYLYFYKAKNEGFELVETIDMAEEFDDVYNAGQYLYPQSLMFMDENEKILAVTNYRSVCFIALQNFEPLFTVEQPTNDYMLGDVAFSSDSRIVAIGYGSDPVLNLGQGGFAEVRSLKGDLVYGTGSVYLEAISRIRFGGDGNLLMTYSYNRTLRVWDLSANVPSERCNPILSDDFEQYAVFCEDYILTVADHLGNIKAYRAIEPAGTIMASLKDNRYPILSSVRVDENEIALLTAKTITYIDVLTGTVNGKIGPNDPEYEEFLVNHMVELQNNILFERQDEWLDNELSNRIIEDIYSQKNIYIRPGSVMKQMLVSIDRKTLYAIGSVTPYFAAYDIDDSAKTLAARQIILFDNAIPTGLWQSSDSKYLALSTETNELWLYKKESLNEPYAKLKLRNSGIVNEISVDASGTFLAVSLNYYTTDGIYHYGILEIWDIASKTIIAEITDNKSWLSGIQFIDDYVYYGMDDELHRLWLPKENISRERRSFVKLLSGYELDKGLTPVKTYALFSSENRDIYDEWSKLYRIVGTLKK